MGLPIRHDRQGAFVIHTRTTHKRTYRTRVPVRYEHYVERRGGVTSRIVAIDGVQVPVLAPRPITPCPKCERLFATAAGLHLHLENYHGAK